MRSTPIFNIVCLAIICLGCVTQEKPDHFFLDGYPDLYFVDQDANPVPTSFFINDANMNSMTIYEISDRPLKLVYRKTKEPYSGFIRTYHWGIYNIEAVFEDGNIVRLRYWHPNRQLAMDMDYTTNTGKAWANTGILSITWDGREIQTRNTATGNIRSIQNDSISYFFDFDGELSFYSTRTDSSVMQYYADGTPRFLFPIYRNGIRDGKVKRWHPNGHLRAEGQYKDGVESGVWVEYDSLGNEIKRVDYN